MQHPFLTENSSGIKVEEKNVNKGRCNMASSISIKARDCCLKEKRRLMKNLERCDTWTSTAYARQKCYQSAARSSGKSSRQCVME